MRARTAVIPAAGLGTRFRPVTELIPKELLPIIDRPALQLVVEECVGAGVDHVVLVSSRSKPAIEAFATYIADQSQGLRVTVTYQDEPKGLGHAVACVRDAVGDEPFAVVLPDELMGTSELLAQMIDVSERTGGSVVGLKQVPRDQVSAYGVVTPDGEMDTDGVISVCDLVEKPSAAEAPSDLIVVGRYVVTPDVFDLLERLAPGAKGEIQLTDALRQQAASGPFHGVLRDIRRHDTGNPLGWLAAVVDLALEDPRFGDDFETWLRARLE